MSRFEDAIMYVRNGGKARRKCWATVPDYTRATPPKQIERRWHIWMCDRSSIINGWGGQIGGELEEDDPIHDGGCYSPTDEDRIAQDWELLN